jgi:energy-coupling factor transporter ATP-binding protein EcfA2
MSEWDAFPESYRSREVRTIERAIRAGECVSVVGLSGAGKSNLMGFLAYNRSSDSYPYILADCNLLSTHTPSALIRMLRKTLEHEKSPLPHEDPLSELEELTAAIAGSLRSATILAILIDRFDIFIDEPGQSLFNNLRLLRDRFKYRLVYVLATRRPLPVDNELAELFHAHTLWLGPLTEADAYWSIDRYAERVGASWDESVKSTLVDLSGGYPSLLRGFCEGFASGSKLEELKDHPAVRARVAEIISSTPDEADLRRSDLADHPLFTRRPTPVIVEEPLTAKEQRLFDFLQIHPNHVCEKDDLIRAVWPEDAIYDQGIRDSSLAQLVRRLRLKIERDPANPQFIQTVPGRGYIFRP